MLKILSIEDCNGTLVGYVEDGEVYRRFEVSPEEISFTAEYPKSYYGEYEHFAAIIGKFDPYAQFFQEPREAQQLTYQELQLIIKKLGQPKEKNHDQEAKPASQENTSEQVSRRRKRADPGNKKSRLR